MEGEWRRSGEAQKAGLATPQRALRLVQPAHQAIHAVCSPAYRLWYAAVQHDVIIAAGCNHGLEDVQRLRAVSQAVHVGTVAATAVQPRRAMAGSGQDACRALAAAQPGCKLRRQEANQHSSVAPACGPRQIEATDLHAVAEQQDFVAASVAPGLQQGVQRLQGSSWVSTAGQEMNRRRRNALLKAGVPDGWTP